MKTPKARVNDMFDFFYGNEVDKFQFYAVPKALFTDDKFKALSSDAKLLYGILLDRCGLSKANKWQDDDGKVYVYFKQEEACEMLNIGTGKAVSLFSEIETHGLICRKKQGQGKPTKIYVLNFTKTLVNNSSDSQTSNTVKDEEVKTSENRKSEPTEDFKNSQTQVKTFKNRKSKQSKIESPYTYINNTEINNTDNLSICQNDETKRNSENDGWTDEDIQEYEEEIKCNIEYDCLLSKGISKNTLDLIVDILLEAYNPENEYIKIQGQSVPRTIVKRQYQKLYAECVEYVLDSISEESKHRKIKNLRAYLKSCLYNAPHTIDLHDDNEFKYDFSPEEHSE